MPNETLQAILDAGLHTFARNGYGAARIGDIAAAAGIGKGTVYLYFSSKEDLLLGVLESYIDRGLSIIDELGLVGVEPEEGIRVFLDAAMDLVAADVDFLSILEQRIFLSDEKLRARAEALFRSMIERLVEKVGVHMRAGTVIDYDLEIVATAVIGALASFRLYRVLHPKEDPKTSRKKVSAELSRFFSAALLARKR